MIANFCERQSSQDSLPEVRWSAPVDSLEPPVLVKEEFEQRFGAVKDKIEGHFSEIKEMVSSEAVAPAAAAAATEEPPDQRQTKKKRKKKDKKKKKAKGGA